MTVYRHSIYCDLIHNEDATNQNGNQLLRLQETMKWGARDEVSSVFRDYIKEKGNRHT
jgi:hypothetical protein